MKSLRSLIAPAIAGLIAATVVAWAAQTNYLGTVFIGDPTTPSNQLHITSDGSLSNKSGTYASAGASQMGLAITTNIALTPPAGSTSAQICVETAGVRYRDDGTAATASVGIPVAAGTCFQYAGPLAALSFTAQSGSPTLDVAFYK